MTKPKFQNKPQLRKVRNGNGVSISNVMKCCLAISVIAMIGTLVCFTNIYDSYEQATTPAKVPPSTSSSSVQRLLQSKSEQNWCTKVTQARTNLNPSLAITYPCETLPPTAVSAVVCMLTGSVDPQRANKILFTSREYIDGAMALGYTVQNNIDKTKTHQLLLVRDGFELAPDDVVRLQSVGWTIGTAPDFPLLPKYVPNYERYTTTYTKVTAIGLEEYQCVLLLDADTLVVGDIRPLMTCSKFTKSHHRVAGTLDLDRGKWHGMNTGSILWRPSSKEMNRVFDLSRDDGFMKRYSSDQDFLNHVYSERYDQKQNQKMIDNKLTSKELEDIDSKGGEGAQVVDLTWYYNAQTHVEAERIPFWQEHLPQVKILHFTRRKGWQCEERYDPPPPLDEMPKTCHLEKGGLRGGTQAPICYCREADKYWNALKNAKELADKRLAVAA